MRTVANLLFLFLNIGVWGSMAELAGRPNAFLTLGLTLVLSFIVILVHELGHAVAVHRQGGLVQSICVMIFHLQLEPRHLTLQPPRSGGDVGGYVAYTFVERWWTTRKDLIVAAAGPAANLAFALAIGILTALFSELGYDTAYLIAGALTLLSIGAGVSNLIPFKGSDGMEIYQALRDMRGRRR